MATLARSHGRRGGVHRPAPWIQSRPVRARQSGFEASHTMNRDRIEMGVAAAWVLAALGLHWEVLTYLPLVDGIEPVEAFLFQTKATIPAIHIGLFTLVLIARRKAIAETAGLGRPLLAASIGAVGIGILAWARFSEQVDLELDSLVLILASGALAAGGFRLLERVTLPLALLWLARPWPPMATHHLHETLQTLTGTLAAGTLGLFADIERSGHILAFDGRLFEVIQGCSGLRLEIALLTATLVYCAFTSGSRRQTLGTISIALLLGPLLNAARVIFIMLAPGTEVAQIHSTQGLIVISVGVVLVAILDVLGEKKFWPRPTPISNAQPDRTDSALTRRAPDSVVLAAVLLCAIPAALTEANAEPKTKDEGWALHEIRRVMGDWTRTENLRLTRDFLGDVKFTNRLFWAFKHSDGVTQASVFAASDNRRRRDYSSFSPKTRTLRSAWEIEESEWIRLEALDVDAERSLVRDGATFWTTLHFRLGERSLADASLRWLLALDLVPGASPPDLVTVRLAVRLEGRSSMDLLQAEARLADLTEEVTEALLRARPPQSRP